MDKLDRYRQAIQTIILQRQGLRLAHGNVETEIIFDKERDHYQIVHVGWDRDEFIYGALVHIDIKHEKIWIQWNGTEDDLAVELVALGIPKEDIVLGLHPPSLRRFTEYATG